MTRSDLFLVVRPMATSLERWSDLTMVRRGSSVQDLPASLRLSSALPFVGRSAELEKLRTLLPAAAGEGLRVVLLGGEPGRQEPAGAGVRGRRPRGRGARPVRRVRRGRAGTYGPFAEALEHLPDARARPAAAALGSGVAELSRLVPDLPTERLARHRARSPTPTPSATGCTPRLPICSSSSAGDAGAARDRGRRTGPTARRSCCSAIWRARLGAPALWCSSPSATPRRRCPRRSRDAGRPPPLRPGGAPEARRGCPMRRSPTCRPSSRTAGSGPDFR